MNLEGTIKNITFHSHESGFSVFRLTVKESRNPVVVTGTFPELCIGDSLKLEGEWNIHPKYGKQFKCNSFTISFQKSENITEYLSSGLFRGIGKKTAENIVKVFGEDTEDILDNHPDIFFKTKIRGLSGKKASLFLASWQENRRSRETLLFLYSHGIMGYIAKRLWNKYGEDTIPTIKENPYILCEEIWGIGFVKADEIAMKVSISRDSPVRIQAAILYVLQESSFNEGHVYLPQKLLIEKTIRLLQIPLEDEDFINSLLSQFEILCKTEKIKRIDEDCFFPSMYRAEHSFADNIIKRLNNSIFSFENFDVDLGAFERNNKFSFDPIQRKAIRMALSSKLSIITGGPGTGKTTILKGILHLAQKTDESVFLAAPTGRAAKRMGELCGLQARTIHRLLEIDSSNGKFKRNSDNPLTCDLLIVDEFSMVDIWLANSLFSAIPYHTRIVLVGDADQLPSVGPGNVLRDLIECPKIPITRLEHIFRQSSDNDIAEKSSKINQGILPSPIEGAHFHFIPFEEPEEAKSILQELLLNGVKSKININNKVDLQILTPMRKGPLGVYELNVFLQDLMNPNIQRHKIRGVFWSNGDRVMQIKNNYEKNVFNGDIGIIYRVASDSEKITVFYDDKTVDYEGDELDELSLAYATTIHKSQGSEYPAVIIILDSSHYIMLRRNLIYTAITRAKGHVWILSARGALGAAVRNNYSNHRFTRLKEQLLSC